MSSSKNKRKRPENDPSGAAATASRRRSRDQRAADEPALVDNKNEQEENPGATTTTEQMGEASMAQAPTENQHEQGGVTGNTPRADYIRAKSADDTTSGEKTSEIPIKQGEDAGESSTSVENVSTSQQEASRKSTVPAPSAPSAPKIEDASKAGDASKSAGGSRESRIQGLIAHRKILLDRIGLTRLACGERLEATKSEGQTAVDSKLPVDKGAAPKEMTDDEEIEAHNEMARLASQAAKKSRQEAEGVQGDKRTSLSLRRGASVGKKMNAALSSLAPGASAHQTSDAPAAQPQQVASAQPPKLLMKSAQVVAMLPRVPAAVGIPPSIRPLVVPQPQTVPSKSMKMMSPPMYQPNSKQVPAGANIQKQRAPNSKSVKVASTLNHKMSSAARPESATLPLHAGTNPATLPPNRLAQKVHFPEAVALREKRSKVQAKLAQILGRQGKIDPTAKESSTDRVSSSTAATTASPIRKKPPPKLPANWEPKDPAVLPKKRKTHWNYVMQEMAWMATDFIEERKWKLSSARTIGLAIRTPGIAGMAPTGARARETCREKNANSEMPNDFKECKMEVEDNTARRKADAPVAKPFSVKAKSQDIPRYIDPTMEDGKSARKVARIVCCMVSELISATLDSGAITRSDQSHSEALERYLQLRRKLITDKTGASLASITKADKKEHEKQATEKAEAAVFENGVEQNGDQTEVEPPEEKNEVFEEKSFESVTEYIETSLHEPAEGRSKSPKKEKPKVLGSEGLRLSSGQKDAIEFVEELWERKHSPGAILSGTAISGKTIATCSILWKQRSNGPQLLVCPPARLIRWMHELGGFKDMRVLPFGLTSGISSPFSEKPDLDELGEGDVIVCEYSALPRLVGVFRKYISKFHSFVIDCRHPVAFPASYQSELEQKVSLPGEARKREWNCPAELISTVWWGDVLQFLLEGDARRLLIEFAETDALSLSTSGLGDRQQLGILAFRAAYIIGPKIFQSPEVPIQKQVASWARRSGKKATADKVARVRNLLEDSTKGFRCDIQGFVCLEDVSTSSRANKWWEIHHCSLPPCQRSAYDQSCAEVRGALSSSLANTHNDGESVFHSLKAVSSALFRLRRQCIHSNLRDIFTNSVMQNRLGPFCEAIMDQSLGRMSENGRTGMFDRKLADSPSQPDSEIAFSILEGSAKLRELVSILKYECDYDLIGEEQLESLLHSEDREEPFKSSSKRKSSGPTKVAILAVLPEVQLLVSALLNSIGIKHDLLLRATSETRLSNGGRQSSDAGVEEASETERNETSALAWAEFQTSLSKFNSDHTIDKNSVDVVITSPVVIAGDNGGLGIEKAGLVICLDEDWSGRGELMMKYIAARWLARNKVISTDRCRLIRLVCEDTIEEKILTNEDPKDESDGDVKPWPVDYSGHFLLPNSDTQAQVLYKQASAVPSSNVCGFPGLNFLKFRGDLLSEVLVSSKDLPPMFGSGAKIRFLPLAGSTIISEESSVRHDEDEKVAEIAFLRDLLGRERIASLGLSAGGSNRLGIEEHLKAVELTPNFVFPPSPSSFPTEMMTRQDLTVVATRLYLERHAKLAVRSQLGIGSGRVSLALLPGIVGTAVAATSSAPVAAASAAINSSSDLVGSWAKSGLSCKPDDFALSLLYYSESSNDPSNDDDGYKSGQSKAVVSQDGKEGNSQMGTLSIEVSSAPRTARRGNSYSKSFSSARDGNVFRDGNQGSEALVYFPPLFPNMLLCSMQASRDTEALLASRAAAIPQGSYDDLLDMSDLPFKRKELEVLEGHGAPNSKRLRVQQPSIPSVAATGITAPAQVLVPRALPIATKATTAPLIHSNQSIATGPQNQMVPVPNTEVRTDVRRAIDDDGASSALFGVDEDYGLLGIGAIPLSDDAALSAAHAFVGTSAFTHPSLSAGHAFFESANPCDAEEAEGVSRQNRKTSLKSMLLFVKKKPRGYAALPDKQGQLYRPSHGLPGADAAWTGAHGLTPSALVPIGGTHTFAVMNGAESPKKVVKKKPLTQGVVPMPSSAFSRLPSAEGPQGRPLAPIPIAVQFSKGKDGFRHRILSSFVSRQIGTGLTMFESSSFRVAAVHVQNRVVDRLAERCWQSSSSYDAGSGLPLLVAKQLLGTATAGKRGLPDSDPNRWTSIVKRLKNSSETGDAAKSLSASQRSALRRSLVSPCRVDFGPFRGGYLAQPSGMTGISPPRPRLGVALPMGVKVPQTLREQSHDAWTARDDQLLQNCAVRFGMNWMLVARASNGFEDAVMTANAPNASETNKRARSIGRSARQCRDRWQALARTQPSLANEVRKSERVLRERALFSPDQIRSEDGNACRMSAAVIKGSVQNTTHLLSKAALFSRALLKKNDLAGGISTSVAKDPAEPAVQNGKTEKEEPVVSMDIDDLPKKQAVGPTTSSNEQGLKVGGLKKQKRVFTAVSLAKTKKQIIPMTIPGVVTGSTPTLVPSHPSHMQAVQESLSAQMSSGRTEMWPLQILDAADTQRAAATAAQKPSSSGQRTAVAAARSITTTSSSSSSRRRPASSAAARSPSQASSDAQQQRPAPFPSVPSSSARSAAQRPQANAASPQRSPPSTSAATAKAYVPPQAVAQAKPGQSPPPSK